MPNSSVSNIEHGHLLAISCKPFPVPKLVCPLSALWKICLISTTTKDLFAPLKTTCRLNTWVWQLFKLLCFTAILHFYCVLTMQDIDDSEHKIIPPAKEDRDLARTKRITRKERKVIKKKSKRPQPMDLAEVPAKGSSSSVLFEDNFFLKSYSAIEVPNEPSKEVLEASKDSSKTAVSHDDEGGTSGSLGKWFPDALLLKCPVNYTNTGQLLLNGPGLNSEDVRVENPTSSLVLFYQYSTAAADKQWSQHQVKLLMTYLSTVAKQRKLGGRIRVAQEGVNATISAVDMPNISAKESLRHFCQDLKNFDSKVFAETDFKYIDDLPADRHFKELRIIPVQELVFYDIKEEEAPLRAGQEKAAGGVHLDAKAYHEMLKKENTVVIDVRNHYETIIGRFDGQESVGGASYIDPKMRKSTDFKNWLAKEETKEKLKDKTVLMFCTGGIRCERASAYLKNKIGDQVEGVYQLQGGIERYLKEYPDGGGFWNGKNFVFDKREAVSADNPNGDGGVVGKKKKAAELGKMASKCCVCQCPWDRYIGKKKCWTCGVPVLMCDTCMSKKPDKDPGMRLSVRCPLCVAENVTVAASEVEFTDNGIRGKNPSPNARKNIGKSVEGLECKAAPSVLKWGGGHAAQKKFGRQMKRTICRFGTACHRADCFFAHPDREEHTTEKKKNKKAQTA